MKWNTLVSPLILVVVCCGCSSKREIVERYPNGSTKKLILHLDRNNYYVEEYHENGNLQRETVFKNGLMDSISTEYCANGGKAGEMTFRNGVRNGITHEFYHNGQIAFEGSCVNDKFEGLSTWYYRNGTIQEKGYRHLGSDTGRWVFYDTTGALTRTIEYRQNGNAVYYNGAGMEISAEDWGKIPYVDQDRCK